MDSDATVPAGFVSNCGGLDVFEEGEPLLQQPALAALARSCAPARIQVETNSTVTPVPGVAESVLVRGWNLTTRLHILLWGDERGR